MVEIHNREFVKVCELVPENENGKIVIHMPQDRYDNKDGLAINRYGHGPFCKFSIPVSWKLEAGVYVILMGGEPIYVGECEDLAKRFNMGYGNISPRNCYEGGQQTNCRINTAVLNAIKEGHRIELLFHRTEERFALEADMIAALMPTWNRSGGKRSAGSRINVHEGERTPKLRPSVIEDGCRGEVIGAAKEIVGRKARNEFTVMEVLDLLHKQGTTFQDSTIRTHVTSRCCGDAPKNHGTTFDDFRRIGRGMYRLTEY